MDLNTLESKCRNFITKEIESDAAHDLAHIQRVVSNALSIAEKETADLEIVLAAAWLHDCVVLPKDHPDRKKASTLAAEKGAAFLRTISYPGDKVTAVAHAIESHSFSAGIETETMEAKIVQDADRLDALGAIGIARCFSVGGQMNSPIYNPNDPFCENRTPDDKKWTIDHFFVKLFELPETMHTAAAREMAEKRVQYMKEFLSELSSEIEV